MRVACISIIILFALLSCKNVEKTDESKVPIVEIDSFDYKLENEPKIFLKYWSGMTLKEYLKVSELLVKEGKITQENLKEYYNLGTLKVEIEPFSIPNEGDNIFALNDDCNFNKNSGEYDGIILRYIDSIGYSFFKTKYNLRDLIEKPRYSSVLVENPYTNGNIIGTSKTLQIFDIGTTNEILDNYLERYFVENHPFGSSINQNLIVEDKIIENENNVIIFKNVHGQCRNREINLFHKSYYKDFDEAKEKEKEMIKVYESNTENVILYLSKSDYKNYANNIERNDFDNKRIREEKINKSKERQSQVLNEI